jgi:aspartyl-tRNA(Asn)/glutamyl-tRNA(Gln) amidotransferase subunit C
VRVLCCYFLDFFSGFVGLSSLKNLLHYFFFMVTIEVDKALIRKVAKNARLNLTEEELEKFVPQIKEIILDSFNKLDEVNAEEKPSFQPVSLGNKFRKDEVRGSLAQEEALRNVSTKLRENGYFKGPKVL